eukprot:scaffold11400_cov134-Isochrysis_galbana.AAC.5
MRATRHRLTVGSRVEMAAACVAACNRAVVWGFGCVVLGWGIGLQAPRKGGVHVAATFAPIIQHGRIV